MLNLNTWAASMESLMMKNQEHIYRLFLLLTKGEGSKNALFERMLFINGPLTKLTVMGLHEGWSVNTIR